MVYWAFVKLPTDLGNKKITNELKALELDCWVGSSRKKMLPGHLSRVVSLTSAAFVWHVIFFVGKTWERRVSVRFKFDWLHVHPGGFTRWTGQPPNSSSRLHFCCGDAPQFTTLSEQGCRDIISSEGLRQLQCIFWCIFQLKVLQLLLCISSNFILFCFLSFTESNAKRSNKISAIRCWTLFLQWPVRAYILS